MGLKTLDLKDVSEILLIQSQFSSHIMLKFRVSTFYVILYYHICFLLTESTYDLLKTFFLMVKRAEEYSNSLAKKNVFHESDYMKSRSIIKHVLILEGS